MQGKGSASAGGGDTKGDAGRVRDLLSAPRHGHQAELPLGAQQEGEQLGPGVGTPPVGTPGALPSSPNPGCRAPKIKGSCPRPALPFGEGQGAHSRPLPQPSPSSRSPLGRCPLQFHKPQGKDAAPGQPLSFSPSPHTAPQLPNPKASRQPRWSRENPKADIRAWQHWAGVPGPSPRAEFRHFGEEPEQPQVTGTGDI